MRLALEVERTLDLEALHAHRRLLLSRLWARVRFQQPAGWSDYHLAIVDTGAPYSLIPTSIWTPLRTERLAALPVRGIVPGRTAQVDAVLAKVSAQILDARHISRRLSLWAMLAKTDQVPLILGWSGCLDRAKLSLDGRRNLAWLEL